MPTDQLPSLNTEFCRNAVSKVVAALSTQAVSFSGAPDVTPQLGLILRTLVQNIEQFDKLCPANRAWIGTKFINAIGSFELGAPNDQDQILSLFTMAYRFMCELELNMPDELAPELDQIRHFVNDNLTAFPPRYREQLVYANFSMPLQIVKKLLHHENVADARSFLSALSESAEYKTKWDEDFQKKCSELDSIKAQLDRYEAAFNFVGLVDGFSQLSKRKSNEKLLAFISLIFLALLAVAPVATQLGFVLLNTDQIEAHKQTLLYSLLPLITLEVVLIYFFRVVLAHFRSIKAQLLQLDLRTALCQFIQSYAEYAAKIKKQDPTALDRFESLVFSGLLSSEENLPSTFDGAEQLAKLLRSVRGGA